MIPIKNKTHFSILQSITKPENLIDFAVQHELPAIGICDNNLSGMVEFCQSAQKKKIKPIVGIDRGYYSLIAKNRDGFVNLNKISIGQPEENFANNLIFISNDFIPLLIEKSTPLEDWEYQAASFLLDKIDLYGKGNCYIGLTSESQIINEMSVRLAKNLNLNTIASPTSYYIHNEDKIDHQVLLCIGLKETLKQISDSNKPHIIPYKKFFSDYSFSIENGISNNYDEYSKQATYELSDRIENYDIFRKPTLPPFAENELDLLKSLCRDGWKEKIWGTEFVEQAKTRILNELNVLTSAPILITYFLIVQDYVKEARNRGDLIGVGRGSAGGSLVSYLLDIIRVNPLQYDLLFERFYNAGRNTPDKTSLPDIDTDFPTDKRQNTIDYIANKYGKDKVAHITTFGTLKGRQSLKDILKVNDAMTFEEINHLTSEVPDEAAIADELQEMEEEGEKPSIIRWAIENNPGHFMDFVRIKEDNSLDGDMAYLFNQAIRLENIKRTKSRHASGIVISDVSLAEVTPLLMDDKTGEVLVGVDMDDAESLGLVKFDILGVAVLKKIADIQQSASQRYFDDTIVNV